MMIQPSVSSFKSLALVLVASVGCGSSAIIERRDYSLVEGEIVGSSHYSVFVDTDHGEVAVPRSQISDIDHPGNVAATIGLILTSYGVLNIAIGAPKCDKEGAAFCTGVFAPAAIGLPVAIYGFAIWGASRKALHKERRGHDSVLSRLLLSPGYFYAEGKGSPGLSVASSF
jgi:hypothetical protein